MTQLLHTCGESRALWAEVARAIDPRPNTEDLLRPVAPVNGGDINRAVHVRHGAESYFVKLNDSGRLDMFQAEAAGLEEIAAADTELRCPRPVAAGLQGDRAFLVLEYVELVGAGSASRLGAGLAALHRNRAPRFGWQRDNTLGTTPQPNDQSDDWTDFLRRNRLGHQLQLAGINGLGSREQERGQELLEHLDAFFSAYAPVASLLHGDLWGGNYGYLVSGEPVIFDPAVYYGDRESDLAMTELFGGFGPEFYAAYNDAWPLDEGYPVRKRLYQLYHVLNHFNLFGGTYGARAGRMIEDLLAELG